MASIEEQNVSGETRASSTKGTRRGVVASQQIARAVRAFAESHGVGKTAKLLGCGYDAVARIAARLPVRAGTLALAEKNLAGLESAA